MIYAIKDQVVSNVLRDIHGMKLRRFVRICVVIVSITMELSVWIVWKDVLFVTVLQIVLHVDLAIH